jgi:plasmid stabilization system protein ParE
MARIALEESAKDDVIRLVEFLLAEDPAAAAETNDLIFGALAVLQQHPLIGRPVEDDLRELVISRGRSGYVALYEYLEPDDLVVVMAIRHQRESGFRDRG